MNERMSEWKESFTRINKPIGRREESGEERVKVGEGIRGENGFSHAHTHIQHTHAAHTKLNRIPTCFSALPVFLTISSMLIKYFRRTFQPLAHLVRFPLSYIDIRHERKKERDPIVYLAWDRKVTIRGRSANFLLPRRYVIQFYYDEIGTRARVSMWRARDTHWQTYAAQRAVTEKS